MDIEMFLNKIYKSIKVGDMIKKPNKDSEILNILKNGNIYYRIGKENKKAVTKRELSEAFNILQIRDLTNEDIKNIATTSKPCNRTSLKWLLTHSGVAVEKSKGYFTKNW